MSNELHRCDFLMASGVTALLASGLGAAVPAQTKPAAAEVLTGLRTGPYLQNPAPDAMTIMWMTHVPCFGYVEYGTTEQLGSRADADVDGMRQANNVLHKIRVAGLKPGTKYYYRVRCQAITTYQPYKIVFGPSIESEICSFTTPDPAAKTVRFIVFNDIHDKVELWKTLYDLVAREPVDFAFLNGDIVDYLLDEKQMVEHFLTPVTQMFGRTIPFLYARGNHETRGAYARQMMQYLDLPEGRYYYGLNWGPMRLTVLDSGEDKPDSAPVYAGLCSFDAYRTTQQRWLERETASAAFTAARWRVTIHHIPAYYNSKPDDHPEVHGAVDLREKWWPLLNKAKVDLFIAGHTHRPTLKPADAEMGHRFPVAIGGGPKKGIGTVTLVEATGDRLSLKMLRDDGETIGEFKL